MLDAFPIMFQRKFSSEASTEHVTHPIMTDFIPKDSVRVPVSVYHELNSSTPTFPNKQDPGSNSFKSGSFLRQFFHNPFQSP